MLKLVLSHQNTGVQRLARLLLPARCGVTAAVLSPWHKTCPEAGGTGALQQAKQLARRVRGYLGPVLAEREPGRGAARFQQDDNASTASCRAEEAEQEDAVAAGVCQ